MTTPNRRSALKWMAGGTVGLSALAVGYGWRLRQPRIYNGEALGSADWITSLATSVPGDYDYRPVIEGTIPSGLSGSLYRNGPGLFDRGGSRKQHILDGDGMIRHFQINDSGVHFRTRFVQTKKYLAEEKAGRFVHPTWTTLQPNWTDQLIGAPSLSQAGVTAVVKGDSLYAIDEIGLPYEMDPASLETRGEYKIADENTGPAFKAHTKTDGETGDWIIVGTTQGPTPKLHVVVRGKDGTLKSDNAYTLPRNVYFHDFFASEKYVVMHLQPLMFSPWAMLAGVKSFTDSLTWKPSAGTILMVIDKSGTEAPKLIEAPATFMWHALNAYEVGNTIIADFVGYDDPLHFVGPNPAFNAIMHGKKGDPGAPGTLRRYTINLENNTAREETLMAGHFEFPIVDPRQGASEHRYGYVSSSSSNKDSFFSTGISRIEVETGAVETFDFGLDHYAGEPIFAPKPGSAIDGISGWLLVETLDGSAGRNGLAIFDAAHISDGPLSIIHLDHTLPLSFHGWWTAS